MWTGCGYVDVEENAFSPFFGVFWIEKQLTLTNKG